MNKLLIILILISIIICSGCGIESKNYEIDKTDSLEFSVFIDETTCVEYLYNTYQKKGGIIVRYNQDGTIKLNENCIKEKK